MLSEVYLASWQRFKRNTCLVFGESSVVLLPCSVHTMSGETCFLCPASWDEECEFCEMSVRYCREHRILHRRDSYCHLYNVDQLEGVGRIMVAGRDIEPGEVVYLGGNAATPRSRQWRRKFRA